jgi:hypothetical protein
MPQFSSSLVQAGDPWNHSGTAHGRILREMVDAFRDLIHPRICFVILIPREQSAAKYAGQMCHVLRTMLLSHLHRLNWPPLWTNDLWTDDIARVLGDIEQALHDPPEDTAGIVQVRRAVDVPLPFLRPGVRSAHRRPNRQTLS